MLLYKTDMKKKPGKWVGITKKELNLQLDFIIRIKR